MKISFSKDQQFFYQVLNTFYEKLKRNYIEFTVSILLITIFIYLVLLEYTTTTRLIKHFVHRYNLYLYKKIIIGFPCVHTDQLALERHTMETIRGVDLRGDDLLHPPKLVSIDLVYRSVKIKAQADNLSLLNFIYYVSSNICLFFFVRMLVNFKRRKLIKFSGKRMFLVTEFFLPLFAQIICYHK